MKKNGMLFGVLIILLIFTYFFQEKRVAQEYERSLNEGKVLSEKLERLKLPQLEMELKDGVWWSGDQRLSHQKMQELVKTLSEIKVTKELAPESIQESSNYFSDPLKIEVNGQEWVLGDISLDQEHFYLALGKRIALALIDGGSRKLVSREEDVVRAKIEELKKLLSLSLKDLSEKQLLRYYSQLPLEKLTLHPEGHLTFDLLLEKNQTSPAPIQGIQVVDKLQEKVISLLNQLTIKEEVFFPTSLTGTPLSTLKFSHGSQSVTWELWPFKKDSADILLVDRELKKSYLMEGRTLRIFFIGLQDYWDKKVIPASAFHDFNRLPVEFKQGARSIKFEVINREPLEFEGPGVQVKPGSMRDLFNLIFNLGQKSQTSRVSQLTPSEKERLNDPQEKTKTLLMRVMGQELLCVKKEGELVVVNMTQGFKSHFHHPYENLNCRLQDVIN